MALLPSSREQTRMNGQFPVEHAKKTKGRSTLSAESYWSEWRPRLDRHRQVGANESGVGVFNVATHGNSAPIVVRQCEYLGNVVEQDHRFIKKRTWACSIEHLIQLELSWLELKQST